MGFRQVATAAAVISAFLVLRNAEYNLLSFSTKTWLGSFLKLFAMCIPFQMIWSILVWPKFFSPLRHVPTVGGTGSWWSKENLRMYTDPRGVPQWHWINSTPHEGTGFIRYRTLVNGDRLLVVSPQALGEVLTTKCYQFNKPKFVVKQLRGLLGMGILLAEGDVHRVQRKNLQPAFAFRHVKNLYPTMWGIAEKTVSCILQEISTGRNVINITDWASRATLDIIGLAGLGHHFMAVEKPDGILHQTYKNVLKQTKGSIFVSIAIVFLPSWLVRNLPIQRNEDIRQAVVNIRETCKELIRDVKAAGNPAEETDILTVALAYGGFTEDELVDQLMTFLAAGHETTATALTWAVYMLCVHPEMQTRLREEVQANLPNPLRTSFEQEYRPDLKDLANLIDTRTPYLNAVCAEVLRYFPPVPLTMREASVDTTIQGTAIPKGTKLIFCPRATNRDPNLWGSDADEFNPERWLGTGKDKGSGRSNYANLTFLHGPRSCIGQSFAKAELVILLAALVGTFEFELEDKRLLDERNIKLRRGATARPAEGINVQVRAVERL